MRARVLAVASVLVAAAGCGSDGEPTSVSTSSPTTSTTSASPTPSADAPTSVLNGRFPVSAGHKLAIQCIGEGSPVVVLEGGEGSGLEENALLMSPVAEETRTTTCTYDRTGTGASDPPSERRRTLGDASADLHDLLGAADLAPPFVLVGPSVGAAHVIDYASRYPRQVAGLVLLDAAAPVPGLDKEFPGPMGWRNPGHVDYVAASRQMALHPPSLGDLPLRIVTAADGDSSVKDQSFWLDLSSSAKQTTLAGGHDLTSENTSGVVAVIGLLIKALGD